MRTRRTIVVAWEARKSPADTPSVALPPARRRRCNSLPPGRRHQSPTRAIKRTSESRCSSSIGSSSLGAPSVVRRRSALGPRASVSARCSRGLLGTTSGRLAWRRRHSCNHARKRERGWPRFGSSGRHRRRRPRRRSRSQNPGPPPHHPPIWGTRGGHNFQRAPHRITRRSQIAPPYGPTRGMYSACPSASESPDLQALPMPEEGLEPPTRGL
jgi:hypothetical protein